MSLIKNNYMQKQQILCRGIQILTFDCATLRNWYIRWPGVDKGHAFAWILFFETQFSLHSGLL